MNHHLLPLTQLLMLAITAGCSSGTRGMATTGGLTTTSIGGTTADPTGSSGGSSQTQGSGPPPGGDDSTGGSPGSSTGDGTGVDPKFDLGPIPDAPPPNSGCSKVDFLFIIDNSGSMGFSQANLLANFPAFIGGIQSTLGQVDSYQVGVVTTDKYEFNSTGCQELSSLVTKTGGFDSSNMICGPYADGLNYMTENDDLATAFQCAAQVGTQGAVVELPMLAMEEAVMRIEGGPGQCNEGFLRDDSLWVIVIITDEADGPNDPEPDIAGNGQGGPSTSPGTPSSWFDTVVAARDGTETNAVVLSLIKWPGGPCEPESDFFDGTNIKDFTEKFTYGFVGGICEPDYSIYFDMATDVIANACDTFVPPG